LEGNRSSIGSSRTLRELDESALVHAVPDGGSSRRRGMTEVERRRLHQ
jgi:hypothetical protein